MVRRSAAGLLLFLALVPAACTDAPRPEPISVSVTSSSPRPPPTSSTTTTSSTTSTTTTVPETTTSSAPTTTPAEVPETIETRSSAPAPPADVKAIIRSEFGDLAEEALNVASCESTFNPSATNGPSRGLFQIHEVHADQWLDVIGRSYWSSWDDPVANARFAHWLHDEAGSWRAWSCRP